MTDLTIVPPNSPNVVAFKPRKDEYTTEMVEMLEKTLESVKVGEITGFVFIGRKKVPGLGRDAFEYIVANALDIGLIGEMLVINQRLARMYDVMTDTDEDPTNKEDTTDNE